MLGMVEGVGASGHGVNWELPETYKLHVMGCGISFYTEAFYDNFYLSW